jgi:hypothetical protein
MKALDKQVDNVVLQPKKEELTTSHSHTPDCYAHGCMSHEPMFTDREWENAITYGQYEQRDEGEVVVFRRIDLCAYVTMARRNDIDVRSCTCHPDDNPPYPCAKKYAFAECARTEQTVFVGLELEEIDEIINGNITITDPNLRDGVYAVVLDVEVLLLEKNS